MKNRKKTVNGLLDKNSRKDEIYENADDEDDEMLVDIVDIHKRKRNKNNIE